MRTHAVWIGCVLLGTLAFASESEPLIRVTAVVTDASGRLLSGLKPDDFDVVVDGKPQAVDSVDASARTAVPRAFAFLLDEFHTAPGHSTAVREALLRFVDQRLTPADLAFVVKPLDALTAIKPTADREVLRRAISTFEGRKGDFAPRTAFERNYLAQAPAAVASARGQIVTSALRAIAVALSQTNDVRPAIVLVSDGFERMRTGRDVPANLQAAARIANRADAPVYAFAPAAIDSAADRMGPVDPGIDALRALAGQTGGDLVIGAHAMERGLARMVRDLDNHYVLTYRAAHGSDGRFHALQVTVRREGVQVRARGGYVAPVPAARRAALDPSPSAPMRVLRRSPLIQSWSGVSPRDRGRAAVTLTWEPAPVRQGTPARARASTIVLTATTADGTVVFDGAVAPAVESGTPEIPNRATFEAPAGRVLVDIKVLDEKGVVLDTDARDVNVPALGNDAPIIFSPAVIRARSGREFREALHEGTKAPIATRDFRRTDRLLIRVPALDAAGKPVPVSGVLLNRWRQPMRDIPAVADRTAGPDGTTVFDVPLAALAPGEYTLRFTATHDGGSVTEHVTFRVQG